MGVTCFLLLSLGLAITAQGQSCSKPVGRPNMSLKDEFILVDTFEDESKVSFACNIGYMSAGGSPVITCTAGKWSPVRLQCQKKNCGSPGEVENGYVDLSEGTEFGDKIVITCDDGFKFVGKQGPREIFCGNQGWDDRLPVCEVVACYPPELPPGVTFSPIKDSYTYREVVRYICPSGLSLNGSDTASCSNDGSFDSDPPTCVKVQCADIQIPNSEKVKGSEPPYRHQDTVTFRCKDGFKMKGERTVTCGINSQWSPALPECEEMSACVSSQRCPPDWREINSTCYFLSTESKTWQESREYCQNKGADLVVINNEQEQRALYRLNGNKYLLFWIGLHGTAGTFKWVDGSMLREAFWQSGQPDHGGPNNIEDCVEWYHFNPELASWNDAPCGHRRHWLCEKAPCTNL